MARFDVVLTDTPDILAAIDMHRLHNIAFWDALIIRAAQRGRCAVLLSENLRHARDIAGLQIVNPFRGSLRATGCSQRWFAAARRCSARPEDRNQQRRRDQQ